MKKALWIIASIIVWIGIVFNVAYWDWQIVDSHVPDVPVSTMGYIGTATSITNADVDLTDHPGQEWLNNFDCRCTDGTASYYDYSLKGKVGYSTTHATAASTHYPRGSKVSVCLMIPDYIDPPPTLTESDTCVTVVINDYGPSKKKHPDRILDLSSYAFKKLASTRRGVIPVVARKID